MIKRLLYIVTFICAAQILHAQQEDGVVAFKLPVRNSLKFNKYAINPTFSLVREQNKYLSFTNKREWVQFENAPQTYLFSYSGRFSENTGVGIGLFQQNYGVLTTFGGVINYAYNAVLDRDSNLTFGMNLGFYKSGINEGNVITNFPDPSLQNIPSNMLITVNPGINYGTTFFDFGVSLNNIVTYNLKTSQILKENPEQSIQGHIMYTGYVDSRGFFDNSKFSGLVRSEFKKEQTVLSGIMMLTTAKGIWGQAGYNTLYGMSAGIGLNITSQIALEYNFEKEVGDLSTFGNSHEITLAFRFNKKYRYNYGDEDEDDVALISPARKSRSTSSKRNTSNGGKVDREAIAESKKQARAEALAKLEAKKAARLQSIEAAKSKQTTDTQAKAEEAANIKLAQEAQTKADEEAKIKLAEETKAKTEEATRVKLAQEAKAKAEEAARVKLAQEAKAKAEEAARIKLAEEAKAKAEEAARVKLVEETKAKAEEAARIKLAQESKAKAEEEARIKLAEEAKAKAEEAARVKLAQEAQAKAEEAARIKAEQEAKIKQEELDAALILVPTDATGIAMNNLSKLATDSKIKQEELLIKLNETVANREKDLKDLKEENDLSEQGIYKEPKPFKSVSAENAALESLTIEIDDIIKSQDLKIKELENLYKERLKKVPNEEDSVNMIYLNEILILKEAQAKAKRSKETLVSELESIKIATEIERKRRIKRAAYDNEQDRYNKDKLALEQIKKFTETSAVPLKKEDFDFGDAQSDNIKIVKDIRNVESGYYLVLAVHSDVAKRDEFLTKAVAAGQNNINFFYDVATSKYYIYYEKFDDINNARNAMQSKGSTPYNANMSMVKIEN
ncbi:PorP/SprF family type IX secretion system membrane protein [Mariniflexile sp. HNIBRBA6329]|uniref:PorP/SprF family type IX secretion system membrane protein n=1 Tax=Mariniflexile sp. HNIBRBA6329 TaxID=3373088 RepID=UPI003745236A